MGTNEHTEKNYFFLYRKKPCHQVDSTVTKPVSDGEFFQQLSVYWQGCCKVPVFCTQTEWLLGSEPAGQNKDSVQSQILKTVQKVYECDMHPVPLGEDGAWE